MRFAFVSRNHVSRFVSMNKLAKALAVLYPRGGFSKSEFLGSDNKMICDSDFSNFLDMHSAACKSLDSVYGDKK